MPELPRFDPHDFEAGQPIDNPYFPLKEGFTYHYIGRQRDNAAAKFAPNPNNVVVTHQTKLIDGVQAVVVHDTDHVAGQTVERTDDYFAQDKAGNVWYLGEFATQFVYDTHGHVTKTTHDGSWQAGVNGAKPGYVMLAHPHVGADYFQEHQPGVSLDSARVIATDATLVDRGHTYRHVVVTKETSALEPTIVEYKYYAPGVGFVLSNEYDRGALVSQSHFKDVTPGHGGAVAATTARSPGSSSPDRAGPELTLALPRDLAPAALVETRTAAHIGMPPVFPVDGHAHLLDLASLF